MWNSRHKLHAAVARGGAARAGRSACACPTSHFVNGARTRAAVPGRDGAGALRPGLLLGRRAQVLADAGRRTRPRSATPAASRRTRPTRRSARGLTGHTEVVRVVFDPPKVELRGAAARLLGEPRPDAGHAPGQRRRHAVPLGDLLRTARRSAPRPRPRATPTSRRSRRRRPRRDHDRDRARRPSSTTPRTTTSSTSRKNPNGYCGLGGTGVACPVGLAARPDAWPSLTRPPR